MEEVASCCFDVLRSAEGRLPCRQLLEQVQVTCPVVTEVLKHYGGWAGFCKEAPYNLTFQGHRNPDKAAVRLRTV